VTSRLVLAVVLLAAAVAVAWLLDRRRRPSVPANGRASVPHQVDRNDFPQPSAPWLVVLWTSRTCDSCQGLFDKLAPLASPEVAVIEVEYQADPELHRRYAIDAAPVTIVVDAQGVTRASFAGAFTSADLWAALARVREG
jgi:hypothetical protein